MLYLMIFALCYLFFWLAERSLRRKKYLSRFIFYSAISILILCFIAGARDYSIGVDVIHYAYPNYKDALIKDISSYLSVYPKEQLYYIISYFSSQIGTSMFFYLFVNEAIILVPLAITFYKLRNRLSYSFSMLMYMLLFYNFSFCYMRQFCAVAFLVLASVLLKENKYKLYILFSFIAFFFHSSSILFSVAFFLIRYLKKWYQTALVLIGVLVTLVLSSRVLPFLFNVGLIPIEYVDRFFATMNNSGVNVGEFALYSILYFLPMFFAKKYLVKNDLVQYYKVSSVIGWLLVLASSLISIYFYRVTFYFRFYTIITMANCAKEVRVRGNKNRVLLYIFMLVVCLIHWWWFTVHINVEQTYPYLLRNGGIF